MSRPGGMPQPSSFAVEPVPGPVALVGVTDEGLGNTTWVASLDDQVVVVDPERHPEPYLVAIDALTGAGGGELLVAERHLHADFLSGAGELVARGAAAVLPAAAHALWPHHAVVDRETLDLGRWRLRVLSTPGHTPEHVAYLLVDAGRPVAVFTGGSLLVGAVARTDLIDPADTDGLTRALWQSINRELLSLPDDVIVLPTHGAGSFCSASGGNRRWTTVGEERRTNPVLNLDEDTFVRTVLDSLGTYPRYFLSLRERNRMGPHVYGSLPLLDELVSQQVIDLRGRGRPSSTSVPSPTTPPATSRPRSPTRCDRSSPRGSAGSSRTPTLRSSSSPTAIPIVASSCASASTSAMRTSPARSRCKPGAPPEATSAARRWSPPSTPPAVASSMFDSAPSSSAGTSPAPPTSSWAASHGNAPRCPRQRWS